jgi:hypothetical protein
VYIANRLTVVCLVLNATCVSELTILDFGFCFRFLAVFFSIIRIYVAFIGPLHDDDFDETFLTEDELELEDVEYRETLAIKHGQDPDKIWKSERLNKFMVRRSIN